VGRRAGSHRGRDLATATGGRDRVVPALDCRVRADSPGSVAPDAPTQHVGDPTTLGTPPRKRSDPPITRLRSPDTTGVPDRRIRAARPRFRGLRPVRPATTGSRSPP
jgi:hypothetical protein